MEKIKNAKINAKKVGKTVAKKTGTKVVVAKKVTKKTRTKVTASKTVAKKTAPTVQTSVWALRSKTTGKIASRVYGSRDKARAVATKMGKKYTAVHLTATAK